VTEKVKKRMLVQLVQELREKHIELSSWLQTSVACGVLTEDGRPNPGLAERIALQGYKPARSETRERLGLPPICISCGQKVKYARHLPAWLTEAVKNLRRLEAAANPAPDRIRVYRLGAAYGRGGKRAKVARVQA
jgi:hypothetical protein